MSKVTTPFKKWAALSVAVITISIFGVPQVRAQFTNDTLSAIAQYTYQILVRVNNLPQYLEGFGAFIAAWLSPDKSDTTAKLQANFSTSTNNILQNANTQLGLQPQLIQDFFGSSVTAATLPYANDLTYQSLLGMPYFPTDPRKIGQSGTIDYAYNYTKNVAGLNIKHITPGIAGWHGEKLDQQHYKSFYDTVTSIQTFNAYVLSKLAAESQNGDPFSKTQLALIQQASSADWFSQVASESIGIVLRQVLMYNSQIYVLLSQLLQTQKQLLEIQAMNNTLLILLNQQNEEIALRRATGSMPGG